MKTKKHILAFELLEKEMEMVLAQEMESLKGGDGINDCVFQSVAFITGRSVMDVQADYAIFYNQKAHDMGLSGVWNIDAATSGVYGVQSSYINEFLSQYAITPGYSTHGTAYGQSSSGSMGLILISTSNGNGHAMDITGMANSSTFYYYDAQNQTTGTISTTDPRIVGIYSSGGGH